MTMLIAAAIAFLATHLVSGTPLRATLVKRLGEWPYRGLYSLVAFITLGWMAWAYTQAPSTFLWVWWREAPYVVMPVAPYYEALTLDETLHYLRRVADSVQIPVMVYNLPHATGVDLTPDVIAGLAREVPNVLYVKNTSPDMAQAARLIHEYGDRVYHTETDLELDRRRRALSLQTALRGR